MASSAVTLGLGIAALGLIGRSLAPHLTKLGPRFSSLGKINIETFAPSKYYRGGFEPSMSKSEASKILGVSPLSTLKRVRAAHKRIMIANHPDKGGSPYLATKINEAKDVLEKTAAK